MKIYEIEKEHPYNCWGAKIIGISGKFGFEREFVSTKNFNHSSSKRSYYDYCLSLEPNTIYQISIGKFGKEDRKFIQTNDNCDVTEIEKDAVLIFFGVEKK